MSSLLFSNLTFGSVCIYWTRWALETFTFSQAGYLPSTCLPVYVPKSRFPCWFGLTHEVGRPMMLSRHWTGSRCSVEDELPTEEGCLVRNCHMQLLVLARLQPPLMSLSTTDFVTAPPYIHCLKNAHLFQMTVVSTYVDRFLYLAHSIVS